MNPNPRISNPRISSSKSGLLPSGVMQWIALAILVAAMFAASRRAAVPAIMAIGKFLWPVLIVWLIWRFVKARISGSVKKFQQQIMDAAQQGGMSGRGAARYQNATGPASAKGEVLDLCAQCGTLLVPGHRCAKP